MICHSIVVVQSNGSNAQSSTSAKINNSSQIDSKTTKSDSENVEKTSLPVNQTVLTPARHSEYVTFGGCDGGVAHAIRLASLLTRDFDCISNVCDYVYSFSSLFFDS